MCLCTLQHFWFLLEFSSIFPSEQCVFLPIRWLNNIFFLEISPAIKENRVTTVQCLSGSGSLRIGADFLAKYYHHVKHLAFKYEILYAQYGWVSLDLILYLAQQHTVYMSQPTYANHPNFFNAAGLAIKTYRYYDPGTCGLDFQGLVM